MRLSNYKIRIIVQFFEVNCPPESFREAPHFLFSKVVGPPSHQRMLGRASSRAARTYWSRCGDNARSERGGALPNLSYRYFFFPEVYYFEGRFFAEAGGKVVSGKVVKLESGKVVRVIPAENA